jgi:hypothetical protein
MKSSVKKNQIRVELAQLFRVKVGGEGGEVSKGGRKDRAQLKEEARRRTGLWGTKGSATRKGKGRVVKDDSDSDSKLELDSDLDSNKEEGDSKGKEEEEEVEKGEGKGERGQGKENQRALHSLLCSASTSSTNQGDHCLPL